MAQLFTLTRESEFDLPVFRYTVSQIVRPQARQEIERRARPRESTAFSANRLLDSRNLPLWLYRCCFSPASRRASSIPSPAAALDHHPRPAEYGMPPPLLSHEQAPGTFGSGSAAWHYGPRRADDFKRVPDRRFFTLIVRDGRDAAR